jgi:hypothetical protein
MCPHDVPHVEPIEKREWDFKSERKRKSSVPNAERKQRFPSYLEMETLSTAHDALTKCGRLAKLLRSELAFFYPLG